MGNNDPINPLTAHLFRENSGKMVAVLSRMFGFGQMDRIMDVVQDTFETALTKWRFTGIPTNPSAWLMQVAKNKAINAFKKDYKTKSFSSSTYLQNFETGIEQQFTIFLSDKEIKDSQLRLLIACCHPDLPTKSQLIISLYILCGFGVPEIAGGLLMKEEAVKKSLSRSKASLRKLDSILEEPFVTLTADRIQTVQSFLYLMFNEGYKTTRTREAINNKLCFEAIRLAKLLLNTQSILSNETQALLSLLFFNISRFPARLSLEGDWLSLEEQDRGLWNKTFIEEGLYYLKEAAKGKKLSRFHLEAIIASLHCSANSFKATDWEKIAFMYRQLEKIEATSPLITLNRIIAESYLPNINSINSLMEIEDHPIFENNFILPATKGDIYRRRGEMEKAQNAYKKALGLAVSPTDQKFLRRKIQQCQVNVH